MMSRTSYIHFSFRRMLSVLQKDLMETKGKYIPPARVLSHPVPVFHSRHSGSRRHPCRTGNRSTLSEILSGHIGRCRFAVAHPVRILGFADCRKHEYSGEKDSLSEASCNAGRKICKPCLVRGTQRTGSLRYLPATGRSHTDNGSLHAGYTHGNQEVLSA